MGVRGVNLRVYHLLLEACDFLAADRGFTFVAWYKVFLCSTAVQWLFHFSFVSCSTEYGYL